MWRGWVKDRAMTHSSDDGVADHMDSVLSANARSSGAMTAIPLAAPIPFPDGGWLALDEPCMSDTSCAANALGSFANMSPKPYMVIARGSNAVPSVPAIAVDDDGVDEDAGDGPTGDICTADEPAAGGSAGCACAQSAVYVDVYPGGSGMRPSSSVCSGSAKPLPPLPLVPGVDGPVVASEPGSADVDEGRCGRANVEDASEGSSRDTRRRLLAMRRESSGVKSSLPCGVPPSGSSESRSRFCDGAGEACGSGRSPTDASS